MTVLSATRARTEVSLARMCSNSWVWGQSCVVRATEKRGLKTVRIKLIVDKNNTCVLCVWAHFKQFWNGSPWTCWWKTKRQNCQIFTNLPVFLSSKSIRVWPYFANLFTVGSVLLGLMHSWLRWNIICEFKHGQFCKLTKLKRCSRAFQQIWPSFCLSAFSPPFGRWRWVSWQTMCVPSRTKPVHLRLRPWQRNNYSRQEYLRCIPSDRHDTKVSCHDGLSTRLLQV